MTKTIENAAAVTAPPGFEGLEVTEPVPGKLRIEVDTTIKGRLSTSEKALLLGTSRGATLIATSLGKQVSVNVNVYSPNTVG